MTNTHRPGAPNALHLSGFPHSLSLSQPLVQVCLCAFGSQGLHRGSGAAVRPSGTLPPAHCVWVNAARCPDLSDSSPSARQMLEAGSFRELLSSAPAATPRRLRRGPTLKPLEGSASGSWYVSLSCMLQARLVVAYPYFSAFPSEKAVPTQLPSR